MKYVNFILGFVVMVWFYVEVINIFDVIFNVQRVWDIFVLVKCVDVKQVVLQMYDVFMMLQLCDVLFCSNIEILLSYGVFLEVCEVQFMIELVGIFINIVEMVLREFKVRYIIIYGKSF